MELAAFDVDLARDNDEAELARAGRAGVTPGRKPERLKADALPAGGFRRHARDRRPFARGLDQQG
jgi:hypothetical protein